MEETKIKPEHYTVTVIYGEKELIDCMKEVIYRLISEEELKG